MLRDGLTKKLRGFGYPFAKSDNVKKAKVSAVSEIPDNKRADNDLKHRPR